MQRFRSDKAPHGSGNQPIVVIGAGYAGLTCANILRRRGYDVIVLEAANYIGGRVKQLKGFVDWKDLDVGSEFIHGERSIVKDMIDQNGWPCRILFTWAQGDGTTPEHPVGGGISLYYLGKEKSLLRYDTDDADIKKVNEVLWGLWQVKTAPGDKRTLDTYLKDNGVPDRALPLAEAGYANTLGASLDKIALESVAELEAGWDKYGGGDFRLDNSMSSVTERLAYELDIRLDWVVKSINYDKDPIVITSTNGESIEASRVVVTVPLSVLKDNDIDFAPPLPKEKIMAIKSIGWENAIKVVMKFSQRFWPSEVHGVICADSLLPEVYFEEPNRVGTLTYQSRPTPARQNKNQVDKKENTITTIVTTTYINNQTGAVKTEATYTTQSALTYVAIGYATGKNAERLSQLSRDQIVEGFLQQLDSMFGTKAAQKLLSQDPTYTPNPNDKEDSINWKTPATSSFLDCHVADWSKAQFIKGCHSVPTVGATARAREELGRPVNERLFFAGEATAPTAFMTIQGAMETGEATATGVMDSLPRSKFLVKAKL